MYSEDVSPNSRFGVVAQSAGSNKYESVYGMDEGNASASAEHDVTPSYEPVKFDDPTYETILDPAVARDRSISFDGFGEPTKHVTHPGTAAARRRSSAFTYVELQTHA